MDSFLSFKKFLNFKKKKYGKNLFALISGGSGRIGSVFTNQLLLNNYTVISLSRNKKQFDRFRKNLPKNLQKKIIWNFLDLTSPESVEACAKFILSKYKKIDILINNASQNLRGERIYYNKDKILSEFWGGFGGSFLLTEKILPILRNNNLSKIINICSIWGLNASRSETYLNLDNGPSLMLGSTKASLIQYTKELAAREIKNNISVNGLVPGWFPRKGKKENLKYINSIKKNIPANRIGKLEDLISYVEFLISHESSYYTGQLLVVDGGYVLW